MWKDKMRFMRDAVIRHSKVAFPIIVIAAVAVTVALALGAGRQEELAEAPESETLEESSIPETSLDRVIPEVPLERNEDGALYTLLATYYNALANGDVNTIQSISNFVEDMDVIRIQELSKYIESYPVIEIYTKPGPVENSYIAYVYTQNTFYGHETLVSGLMTFYVCTNEEGNLYLNDGETSEDIQNYIRTVSLQEDVVELNNKVNAEYNDQRLNDAQLDEYISELEREVNKATGEALAAQVAASEGSNEGEGSGQEASEAGNETSSDAPTVQQGPVYATATTTVNVRNSDSELADRLGKITGGTRVQVSEQRVNGWTKIVYEGKDGYVKSEYLQIEGDQGSSNTDTSNGGGDAVKTATATTNINLRKEASETAEKIGTVVGGDSVEVLSEANGWSQIRYNGSVGYVKSEYLQ